MKTASFNSKYSNMSVPIGSPADKKKTQTEQRVTNLYAMPFELGRELITSQNFEALIQAYKSWIYVCSSKNSNTVANCSMKLYVGKSSAKQKMIVKTKSLNKKAQDRLFGLPSNQKVTRRAAELEEVVDHPFLDLIESVNPLLNRFDLWDLTQIWLELTGNAYWYVYADKKMGIPQEIWPINPQFMKIVLNKGAENLIEKYVYRRGTIKEDFTYEEIIHFKFSSPQGSGIYGMGPLWPVMDSYNNDQAIRTFETSLMKNMGRPDGVLKTENRLTETQWNRLDEMWRRRYGGTNKVGKTLILESGLDYQPITFTPREMNYVMGRKMTREEIAAAFGVPMSKITSDNINLANAYVGELQYMRDTIEPRLRRIEEKINERLMPMYDENLFVAYDTSIPADREFEIKKRESNLRNYITSINEERTSLGIGDVDWGDVPLVPAGISPLTEERMTQPPVQSGGPGGHPPGETVPDKRQNPEKPEETAAGGSHTGEEKPKPIQSTPRKDIYDNVIKSLVEKIITRLKGGSGSGNFGHSGRTGQVGGSGSESNEETDMPVRHSEGSGGVDFSLKGSDKHIDYGKWKEKKRWSPTSGTSSGIIFKASNKDTLIVICDPYELTGTGKWSGQIVKIIFNPEGDTMAYFRDENNHYSKNFRGENLIEDSQKFLIKKFGISLPSGFFTRGFAGKDYKG